MNFKAAKLTNPASWFDDQYQLWLQTHQSRPVCKLPGKKPVQLCVMVEQHHLQHSCNTVETQLEVSTQFQHLELRIQLLSCCAGCLSYQPFVRKLEKFYGTWRSLKLLR